MKKKDWIIFMGDLSIAYSRGVLRGVTKTLESQPTLQRYAVYHIDAHELPQLDTGDVAGMLVAGLSDRPKVFNALAKWKIPMVDVAGDQQARWLRCCSRTDDEALGRKAADYLLGLGFRRFAFLGHGGHLAMARRQESFVAAINEKNFSVKCFQGASERVGRRWWPPGMQEWIKKVEKPAAVFCCNDLRANALLVACHRIGVRVPEDVALLGVDDDDVFGTLQHPHISSVSIQTQIIAENALRMLVQQIEGKTPPPLALVPPGPVIARASTNILAVDDELVREALAYIKEHLSEGVCIKRLVSELAVSRPTLEKRFAAVMGRSPASEVRRQQVDRTRTLLATTELAMPTVAARAGFSSAQQLSVSFKRFTGESPMEYRKKHSPRVRREVGL